MAGNRANSDDDSVLNNSSSSSSSSASSSSDIDVSNQAMENEKTLTGLLQKQRRIKEELEKINQEKRQAYLSSVANSEEVRNAWEKFDHKCEELLHMSHGYGAGWTRLYDLLWVLHDAMTKQRPINLARSEAFVFPVVSMVGGAVGGLFGGVAGAVGTVFGAGDGIMAGARSGARWVQGLPDESVGYYVDLNDKNTLDYWLQRSDGKALTNEEKRGYMADVDVWLKSQGYARQPDGKYEPSNPNLEPLTRDVFARLRDNPETGIAKYFNPETGLAQYFAANHPEARKNRNAEKLDIENIPEVRMGM
jgi:glucan-binding YG repeat protein